MKNQQHIDSRRLRDWGLRDRYRRWLWFRWLPVVVAASLAPVAVPAAPAAATPEPPPATPVTEQTGPGRPVVATMANGDLMMFIRRGDGTLWRRQRTADGWRQWAKISQVVRGNPAVGQNLNGGLVVFVRDTNNRLRYQVQRPDGTWQVWRSLGTPSGVRLAGTPAVAVNDNRAANALRQTASGVITGNTDSRMEVFVRGADGKLWHRAQRASDGTVWTSWRPLGANLTGNPTAVVGGDGRISLFARDTDGRVRHSAQKHPGRPGLGTQPLAEWSPWQVLTTARNARRGEDIAVAVNTIGKFGTLLQVFANSTGGRLWTMTQSLAGTPTNPSGKWAEPENLRRAFASAPIVAAGRDGRLHVFGTRGQDHRIAYRSQVSPVAPADPDLPDLPPDPNGNWHACCTNWAGGPAVRQLTVANTGTGLLELFAIGRADNSIYQRRQLTEGHPAAPAGKWRAFLNLNPVNAPCRNAGTLECLTITDQQQDLVLEEVDSGGGTSAVVSFPPDGPPSRAQQWRIEPAGEPGVFTVANRQTGRCLSSPAGDWDVSPEQCDSTDDNQRWFLDPVATDDTSATPNGFNLRTVQDDSMCLVIMVAVFVDSCESSFDDEKILRLGGPSGDTAAGVIDAALEYAGNRCNTAGSSCRFVEDTASTPPAYNAAPSCVSSQVVFNSSTVDKAMLRVHWEHTTGTEFGLGAEISVAFPIGLSVSFNAEHRWVQQTAEGDEYQFPVPPRHFGWTTRSLIKRESIGHWEFTNNGRTWTLPGHNVAYAQDGTEGRSLGVLTSVTSPSPPTLDRCPT